MSMIDSFSFDVTKSNVYWKSAIKDGKLNFHLATISANANINLLQIEIRLKENIIPANNLKGKYTRIISVS